MSEKLPLDKAWAPQLDWDSEPGQVLLTLQQALKSAGGEWLVNVFGSVPLTMAYGNDFISNDVDTSVAWHLEPSFEEILEGAGLRKGDAPLYIQPRKEAAFRTSPRWKDRAYFHGSSGVAFRFAHPIDILIGKIHRLEAKDLKAFYLVEVATGEPTESNLLRELQSAPDLFSHAYLAPFSQFSYAENVCRLWQVFFQKSIDLEKDIFIPARNALAHDADALIDSKGALRKLASASDPTPQQN